MHSAADSQPFEFQPALPRRDPIVSGEILVCAVRASARAPCRLGTRADQTQKFVRAFRGGPPNLVFPVELPAPFRYVLRFAPRRE
jgi:hypothetical protein